jgi:toxin ParE1/3/4
MSARRLRLILAPDAQADLSDILTHSEQQWGKRQRSAYKALIDTALRNLTRFPGLGRSRDDISPGLRSHPVGSHVILYRASESELTVNRIVHSRRDISDDMRF